MNINSLYSVKIKKRDNSFTNSVALYRNAVDFLITVCLDRWDDISAQNGHMYKKTYIEQLVHRTKAHPHPEYDFDGRFYKFPSYLLRSAIAEALGKVSSYKSNLANWETADPSTRGNKPSAPKAGYVYPCLYRDGTFIRTGT